MTLNSNNIKKLSATNLDPHSYCEIFSFYVSVRLKVEWYTAAFIPVNSAHFDKNLWNGRRTYPTS